MKHFLYKALKVAWPFVFGLGILWWIYRDMDWRQIEHTLCGGMNWGWMLFSLIFGALPQIFRGLRWRQTLQPLGENPRRRTCIDAIFLSYASSLVVPRIGEVTRCGTLSRMDGTSFSKSLGTVVTERAVDAVIMLGFTAVAFALQIPIFRTFIAQTGAGFGGILGRFTTTGYIVTAVCILAVGLTLWVLAVRLSAFRKIKGVAANLASGVLSLRHVERPGLYVAYSLGIWVGYFLHFYLTFFCFPSTAGLGLTAAAAAFCIGSFAVLVPTPNGAGPWHFAVKTVLMLYGVGATDAIVFALVVHSVQTLFVVVLGIYGWADLACMKRIRRPAA